MRLRNSKNLIVVFALFACLIVLKHFIPQEADWSLSFSGFEKKPFGCIITREMLKEVFPGKNIDIQSASLYMTLKNPGEKRNLIIICDEFSPDLYDCQSLLRFIEAGNNVFISAMSYKGIFSDTLKFKTDFSLFDTSLLKRTREVLHLSYYKPSDSGFVFKRYMPDHFFTAYDTAVTSILGTDENNNTNFIMNRFGRGQIYLHCQPFAFTNYHMLYGNHEYANAALWLLPLENTIWDQYYKPDRVVNTSFMRYILGNAPLQWGYYVALITLLFLFIFGSKRIQRIIPVIKPLQNSSLNFIKTVGGLYFKSQNHADLAKKKVAFFHEHLVMKYRLKQPFLMPSQIKFLSLKTSIEEIKLLELLTYSDEIARKSYITREELFHIHTIIEEFYKISK